MRCAVWTAVGKIEIQDWPQVEPKDDEVSIRVAFTGICASDVHIIQGRLPVEVMRPPRILGHEFSGVIEAVGTNVRHLSVGQPVVAHPNGPCGQCFNCRQGEENYCTGLYSMILGPGQGSFAEFTTVKAKQVYPLPAVTSLQDGAMVEPTAIAVHCISRAAIVPGDRVLVIGGGTIGLLSMQMARLAGASQVILSEPLEFKRQLALRIGADVVIDPLQEDLIAAVKRLTGGGGVDLCIEAVGLPQGFEQAIELVRERGRIVLVGWPPPECTSAIPPYRIYRKELEIRGSFFSPYSFQRAIALLPRVNLSVMQTHVLPLEQIQKGLDALKREKRSKFC